MQSKKVSIVTDSTADIPERLLEEYAISQVSNILIIGNQSYEDGKDLSRAEFYSRLPGMNPLPTTATPPVTKFQHLYENLLTAGATHVLSMHASSTLSGIYNAARLAAQEFHGRVEVFDSQFITLGLGFQCLDAAEAALDGMTLENIIKIVDVARKKARVIAMLDTLEYVRRSGRVSWAKARIGNLLRLKPFIELRDGLVHSLGEARTRRKGIERLIDLIQRQGAMKRLAILHTNAESEAYQILQDLNPRLSTKPEVVFVTTIIGAHVGPNGLGFAGLAL
jgi:DegV family protein with EDD domain